MKTCKHCGRDRKNSTCQYCATKRYRQKHPIRAVYTSLRNNAKRRGKEFNLTLEQFEAFAVKTKLLYKRGRSKDSHTVERIDPTRGYVIDNIAMLTLSENSRKGVIEDKKILNVTLSEQGKAFEFESIKVEPEDLPF